jgi:hypothetical protein
MSSSTLLVCTKQNSRCGCCRRSSPYRFMDARPSEHTSITASRSMMRWSFSLCARALRSRATDRGVQRAPLASACLHPIRRNGNRTLLDESGGGGGSPMVESPVVPLDPARSRRAWQQRGSKRGSGWRGLPSFLTICRRTGGGARVVLGGKARPPRQLGDSRPCSPGWIKGAAFGTSICKWTGFA